MPFSSDINSQEGALSICLETGLIHRHVVVPPESISHTNPVSVIHDRKYTFFKIRLVMMGLKLVKSAGESGWHTSGERLTRFICNEIFQARNHDGPVLSEAPVVVDVSTTIGLFSLSMKEKYPLSRIIAFEPPPETFDSMWRNPALHGASEIASSPRGLEAKGSMGTSTDDSTESGKSTLVPEEKKMQLPAGIRAYRQLYTSERFRATHGISVPTNTLSKFLRSYHPDIQQIDLLKVDVEGGELQVLKSIDTVHWDKVRNIAMEVSDSFGTLKEVQKLLESRGFVVSCSSDKWAAEGLQMYILWGRRSGTSSK